MAYLYTYSPAKNVASHQHDRITAEEEIRSKFIQDTPPLLPTLTSSKYHIRWTRLADLPAPVRYIEYTLLYKVERFIYVTGGNSPVEDAAHQVYVYDIDNDRWGQLPTPDHYLAVPHIIGGKLTLIG